MGFETESFSALTVFGSKEPADNTDILVMDIILAHFGKRSSSCEGMVSWLGDCRKVNWDRFGA